MFGEHPIGEHPDPEVRKSFVQDGIVNPVFLWARFDKVWVRYGACRVAHAQKCKLAGMEALIADFDDAYPEWKEVSDEEAMECFRDPPVGVKPHHWVRLEDGAIDLWVTENG